MSLGFLNVRAGLGDTSARARVRRTLTRATARSAKAAAAPVLAVARRAGLFGLPRGLVHADDELAGSGAKLALRGTRVDLAEPPRVLDELGVGDRCPEMRPVTTSVTILDGSGGALGFANNLVVDGRRRIVFPRETDNESGKPFAFRDLRVWRSPLERPRRIAGSVGYLSNTGVHNFGHWFLFIYPLVQHYRDYLGGDPDHYYVGGPVDEWHYISLEALGIERDRVVTEAVVGDRMLAAIADHAIPSPTGFLDFSTNALRRPRDDSRRGERIYISRAMRPTRPLVNEEKCIDVLKKHGFEPYCTEALTFDEELRLFANADIVVALNGAGLANLLFCNPGCILVELHPFGYTDTWFAEVCAVRKFTYASVIGLPTPTWGLRPRHYHALVDLDKLDEVAAAAVEASERRRSRDRAASGFGGADGR